jgi:O-antigen/teichoic acid export membrane protein
MIVGTLRYLFIIPIIAFISSDPLIFFGFQLIVAIIEFSILYLRAKFLICKSNKFILNFRIAAISSVIRFSMGIGITAIVWAFVTQFDRLILSKILTLSDYGIFSMVTALSGGILMLAAPLGVAIIPRLTSIISGGNELNYRKIYSTYSKLVVLVSFPAALILAIFPKKVIEIWTGNIEFADDGYLILSFYTIGNALVNIASIPFSIQYALGNIKHHVFGNLIFSVLYLPIIYFTAENYGAIGTGFAWIVLNIVYIFLWIPIIHKNLDIISFWEWIKNDIGIPVLVSIIPVALLFNKVNEFTDRYYLIGIIATTWILSTLFIIATVKEFREYAFKRIIF